MIKDEVRCRCLYRTFHYNLRLTFDGDSYGIVRMIELLKEWIGMHLMPYSGGGAMARIYHSVFGKFE